MLTEWHSGLSTSVNSAPRQLAAFSTSGLYDNLPAVQVALRLILTSYMAWLLVVFLPGHTRGQITMGPREAALHASSCCSKPSDADPSIPGKPTQRDKANCAVCFWAAGLLSVPIVHFDFTLSEKLEQLALLALEQWGQLIPIRESLGRDPPTWA